MEGHQIISRIIVIVSTPQIKKIVFHRIGMALLPNPKYFDCPFHSHNPGEIAIRSKQTSEKRFAPYCINSPASVKPLEEKSRPR